MYSRENKTGGEFYFQDTVNKKQIIVIVVSVLAAVLCIVGIVVACVRVSLTEKIGLVQGNYCGNAYISNADTASFAIELSLIEIEKSAFDEAKSTNVVKDIVGNRFFRIEFAVLTEDNRVLKDLLFDSSTFNGRFYTYKFLSGSGDTVCLSPHAYLKDNIYFDLYYSVDDIKYYGKVCP